MTIEKTSVALALDDLERDAVRLVQSIHALRVLADMPSVHAQIAFLQAASASAPLANAILDGFSALLAAKKQRDDAGDRDAPPK